MFYKKIGSEFVVREIAEEDLKTCLQEHFNAAFKNRADDFYHSSLDESSRAKIIDRTQKYQRYRLRLIIFRGAEVVGWHYGYAVDGETYYMQNSAVLEAYRGQGLYTGLLEAVLDKLGQEGFQVVTSTHHPNNAAVLIPKIRKGFIITAMHFHERFRSLIELKSIYNQDRRKSFHRNLGLEV